MARGGRAALPAGDRDAFAQARRDSDGPATQATEDRWIREPETRDRLESVDRSGRPPRRGRPASQRSGSGVATARPTALAADGRGLGKLGLATPPWRVAERLGVALRGRRDPGG